MVITKRSLLAVGVAVLIALFGGLFLQKQGGQTTALPSYVDASGGSIYMKFDGVDGEVVERGHKGWIDVLSFNHGYERSSAQQSGTARRRGETTMKDISVTKELDKSSPYLAKGILSGRVFPSVKIVVLRDSGSEDGTASSEYYAYELKNVMVTSYDVSASSDSVPSEQFSLSYEKIKVTYTEQNEKGEAGDDHEYEWDKKVGK